MIHGRVSAAHHELFRHFRSLRPFSPFRTLQHHLISRAAGPTQPGESSPEETFDDLLELGPQIKSQRGPLEAWGPLELDGAPDEESMGP